MGTIKDIARLADLSIATVSRALNDSDLVSDETKQKVRQLAKELGYKPNLNARNLVKKHNYNTPIGLLTPRIVSPFFFEMIKGIYQSLVNHNENIFVFNTGVNREQIQSYLSANMIKGLIIIADRLLDEELRILKKNNIKFIFFDYKIEEFDCLYFDNVMGGEIAGRYLLSKKIKNLAFIGDANRVIQPQILRLEGFRKVLSENNIEHFEEIYLELDGTNQDIEPKSFEETCKLFERRPDIEGIFYFCDEMAYGGLRAREKLKKDFYIIGYDDLPISKFLNLTTIRQNSYLMGKEGTELFLNILNSKNIETKRYHINYLPELIVRGS